MKQMLQYLKAYKKESIIAPLFKMLEASFELCSDRYGKHHRCRYPEW